jgi:predicted alpha/beta-hydrolase family hydrolase
LRAAVLAPGYGATSEQPIVRAMAAKLAQAGITARAISYSRPRPGADLGAEIDDVRHARAALVEAGTRKLALVGRSFGGRVCARLAAIEPPDALVLLGHPIAPPTRPRPDDEAALAAVRCPTLIVQGDRDRLGPLDVLRRIASRNARIDIYVLKGVGHQFGARQTEGLERATEWLSEVMP